MVKTPCSSVVVGVAPVPVVIFPPVKAACNCSGIGWLIPNCPNCCFAKASEVKTFPWPILPVGGVMTVVVTVGAAPGVAAGVVVVKVMGVPFLRPVTTAVESEPRNELKVSLILPVTFVSP